MINPDAPRLVPTPKISHLKSVSERRHTEEVPAVLLIAYLLSVCELRKMMACNASVLDLRTPSASPTTAWLACRTRRRGRGRIS